MKKSTDQFGKDLTTGESRFTKEADEYIERRIDNMPKGFMKKEIFRQIAWKLYMKTSSVSGRYYDLLKARKGVLGPRPVYPILYSPLLKDKSKYVIFVDGEPNVVPRASSIPPVVVPGKVSGLSLKELQLKNERAAEKEPAKPYPPNVTEPEIQDLFKPEKDPTKSEMDLMYLRLNAIIDLVDAFGLKGGLEVDPETEEIIKRLQLKAVEMFNKNRS